MPKSTEIERRNKAILSLFLLTTPRISSLMHARINRIKYFREYEIWAFVQDPRLQNTKYSKNITAFFIGQSEDITQNVLRWQDELISKGFRKNDFLFPRITPSFTPDGGSVMVLTKEGIKSDSHIREVVKEAFQKNGLPYLKPHSFRHSIARKVRKETDATDKLIALAENLGQKSGMATIITCYAGSALKVRAETIKNIRFE